MSFSSSFVCSFFSDPTNTSTPSHFSSFNHQTILEKVKTLQRSLAEQRGQKRRPGKHAAAARDTHALLKAATNQRPVKRLRSISGATVFCSVQISENVTLICSYELQAFSISNYQPESHV
jgi:hypothetical protein